MYLSAAQLKKSKIFDTQGNFLCQVKRVIIDPQNGQVLGFITNLPSPQNILSIQDIMVWKQEFIVLSQYFEFHLPEEIVRIDRALAQKPELIGKKVKTDQGRKLGKVIDYSLDMQNNMLASITAQTKILNLIPVSGHLIHQKNILEIKPRTIIVKDSFFKVPLFQSAPQKFAQNNFSTFDQV